MKKGLICMIALFCLGGCSRLSNNLSEVDCVHIVLQDENSTLEQISIVVNDPSSIEELVNILSTAKIGSIVRDDEMSLQPAIYYELYNHDEVVDVLMFNGEDTLRIFRGGFCFDVEYKDLTLGDWYIKEQESEK
ncbi:MAG: hypothetical protein K2G70_03785 [Turicibacter sp.]|nr:hypothetical protein [Turicibacter sp.]